MFYYVSELNDLCSFPYPRFTASIMTMLIDSV